MSIEPVPCSDGQADVGLDLIGNVGADSAHGGQRLGSTTIQAHDTLRLSGPTGSRRRRHGQASDHSSGLGTGERINVVPPRLSAEETVP